MAKTSSRALAVPAGLGLCCDGGAWVVYRYFRTSLDHWSTMLGMVFALNFPMATKWLAKVEDLPRPQQILAKTVVGVLVRPSVTSSVPLSPRPSLCHLVTMPHRRESRCQLVY
jgi:hypothetical protein